MRKNKPEWMLFRAVHGMLPKNKLRARMIERLKIYPGPVHLETDLPEDAQSIVPAHQGPDPKFAGKIKRIKRRSKRNLVPNPQISDDE